MAAIIRRRRRNHIQYEETERTRSEIYVELLPLLDSSRVELLDSQKLVSQLCGLVRKVKPSGKDSIDWRP